MLSHSSRKGRLIKGRESIKVRIRAACSVKGTSGEEEGGEEDEIVGADCCAVLASLSKGRGQGDCNGFDVAVSNRWRTSWRIVDDSNGSCSESTDGADVTRTRVLMAILN